jgi:hypothetical protein
MRPSLAITNVWVPGTSQLFVAPELILHYVRTHEYVLHSRFRTP